MKYAFPAVFTPEENNQFSVNFPDIESCYTGGDGIVDAIEMAEDVLCLMLYHMEQDKKDIPKASRLQDVKTEGEQFVTLVAVDTEAYRRFYENKSVKKTLTIPMWLNEQAEQANVNFSQTLQKALKEELNIAQ